MAGSNSTTRGVPRRILQGDGPSVPAIGAGSIPTIQYSTGAARALQQFSRDMFSLSASFEDQLDQQAQAEATTQGAIAGAAGDFELQDYGTIRGRAFNKAAVEAFASKIDTMSIAKLNELQGKYWNSPDQLEQEWNNWRSGFRDQLAQRSPEQAAAFDNRSLIRGLPAIEQAKDTAYKLTRSEADAALVENETALRSEIKNHSADLFSDNPDRARAAAQAVGAVQADYMNIYNAVDPTTGKPLYTPEEKAKAKKAFSDLTMTQATLSWFDEQEDKAAAYMRFINGDFGVNLSANNDQVAIRYANQGAKRNLPLTEDVANKVKAAAAATGIQGVSVVVHSGGQSSLEEFRAGTAQSRGYTGSTRHVHGGAGDLRLAVNGKVLDFASNREAYLKFAENAAAAGLTGIGVDEANGYIHAGGGKEAAWGYRGKSSGRQFLPDDFAAAIERGRGQKLESRPSNQKVALADVVSPRALESIDSEMRSRITFANQMREREDRIAEKRMTAEQDRNAFDFTSRVFAVGATDPATGQPVKPLTREEVINASRLGMLKPGDGEAILKAMATEKPEVSDPTTYRSLMSRVYAGEDIYSAILGAGDLLSAKDAESLLAKNQSLVRGQMGEFSNDQKFFFDSLKMRMGQTSSMAVLPEAQAYRAALAYEEYRRRVLDPENTETPQTIVEDIVSRAQREEVDIDNTELTRLNPPRFSVMVPDRNRVDVEASKRSLQKAYNEKRISDAQLLREVEILQKWDALQQRIDRQEAERKPKK